MTVTFSPPPPPLPVRDRATAQDRTTGALSPMLRRLAEEEATGVLEREHGTLHLAGGRVVHAESPHAPGLGVLLTAHGTLATAAWQRAAEAGGPADAAHRLLEAGLLPEGALALCHLDALYDAGYFALSPSSTPGRFRYDSTPRRGPLPSVPVVQLERETLHRRLLLHRLWPDAAADSAALVRAVPAGTAPVTPRGRAVLDRVDGVRTAPEIARALGRQAFHTLVDVRRLTAAGLVRPVSVPYHPPYAPPAPPPPPLTVTDPDIALLKRLRDALEAL
ncbi:transcriptional regulator [Streptomyces sp. J2-1]|uniref:transcriptional regulator n=1 Tax=Streptomyces corallincola TaxID=2851888 RepID=UPI001C38A888|nr:transcriptional regulator [Streptomyces corallincola]MBV2356094.1 transcriptional regulator [Streptomyces corallincola]